MKEFLKTNWKYIVLIVLLIASFIAGAILFSNNSNLRNSEKASKIELKALHTHNKELEKEIKLNRDSIQIFHDLAIFHKNKDTVYLNQIKYLQIKTNEEISHFNSLELDSQYIVFSNLIEEYSRTGFNTDK